MGGQATRELVDGFVDTLVVELSRGIRSAPRRVLDSWLKSIRIVERDAIEDRAQEKRVDDRF
jgi:hypothetical protein